MKVMLRIIAVLIVFLSLVSCQSADETVVVKDIENKWNKKNILNIDFGINDFQNPKSIIFIVRNNNDYPYSNLRLIASLEHNKKAISTDTLNFVLAKPNGEWIGSGFGDTKETLFQYNVDYKFPQNGNYSIKVTQAMRLNVLPGIEDLGIKVQNTKP